MFFRGAWLPFQSLSIERKCTAHLTCESLSHPKLLPLPWHWAKPFGTLTGRHTHSHACAESHAESTRPRQGCLCFHLTHVRSSCVCARVRNFLNHGLTSQEQRPTVLLVRPLLMNVLLGSPTPSERAEGVSRCGVPPCPGVEGLTAEVTRACSGRGRLGERGSSASPQLGGIYDDLGTPTGLGIRGPCPLDGPGGDEAGQAEQEGAPLQAGWPLPCFW